MSKSENISLVLRVYESGANPDVTREVMDKDILWDITPGFPFGGVYEGYENTLKDFFGKFLPHFSSFLTEAQSWYGDEEGNVFVIGEYHGVTLYGKKADVRFIHHWTVKNGKLTSLKQVADSFILREALGK